MTIQEFLESYCAFNQISPRRREQFAQQLHKFEAFAGGNIEVATPDDFRRWMESMVSAGLHPRTIGAYAILVRAYYQHAWRVGEASAELHLRIRDVKAPRGAASHAMPRPYSRKDLEAFNLGLSRRWPYGPPRRVAYARKGKTKLSREWLVKHGMRLQIEAIVALALDCGLRRNEIYQASIDDIHPDNSYVAVRAGKSEMHTEPKFREVPYTVHARTAVARWFEHRDMVLHPPHDRPWVAVTYQGTNSFIAPQAIGPRGPMSLHRLSELVTTIPLKPHTGGWELHRFRHTCATMWLRAGLELEQVQKLLGHSSILMTQRYIGLVREDIQKAVQLNEEKFNQLVGRT